MCVCVFVCVWCFESVNYAMNIDWRVTEAMKLLREWQQRLLV